MPRLCAFFSLVRLLIAVALKGEPFTYAGSGIAQWPANDADRLKKAPLGPLMYLWPSRGLITKSKPSRWAAVSSSRNDFAKHEVICLRVPRKSLEWTGPLGGHPSRKLREAGEGTNCLGIESTGSNTFVFGSETHTTDREETRDFDQLDKLPTTFRLHLVKDEVLA